MVKNSVIYGHVSVYGTLTFGRQPIFNPGVYRFGPRLALIETNLGNTYLVTQRLKVI